MDIAMFFQFPGILITIGVALLLISIIIIIIAYKSEEKDVDASKLSTNINNANVKQEGYYDNGKPKIILESVNEENKNNQEEAKVYQPTEEKPKITEPQMGIKDKLESIQKEEIKEEQKENVFIEKEEVIKTETPVKEEKQEIIEKQKTADAFEEEFKEPAPAKKYRLPELEDEIKNNIFDDKKEEITMPKAQIQKEEIEEEKAPVVEPAPLPKKEEPKEEIVIKPEQIIEDEEEIELL